MRRIATLVTLITAMLAIGGSCATAEESLLNEFITAFQGRWVAETPAAQDVEGYWKKGEMIQSDHVFTPLPDQSGMRYDVKFAKDGKAAKGAHGICTWDPVNNVIKQYGFAPGGFQIEIDLTKEREKWISSLKVTHPDGKTSHTKVAISISDDGNTHTAKLIEGTDKNGVKLDDFTRVSKRISKNQEVLEKELAWIIGDWECEVDVPGMGAVTFISKYKWVADKHVIQVDMTLGPWKGLSIIFYDPSDETVKMWGANSFGGNGQAVLEIDDDELEWTNTTFDAEGRKEVGEFAYVKTDDPDSFVVKYVDQADGKAKQVTAKRVK